MHKEFSGSGKKGRAACGLDMDMMYEVLGEEKPNQREQIKINADSLSKYFPPDFTPKQKVELIEQLVKDWHEQQAIVPVSRGR